MNFLSRAAALLIGALALTAQAQNLSVATGGTGGGYYPLRGGPAAGLSKYVQGMQATAEVTRGSVAKPQLNGTGQPYGAVTNADATLAGYKGHGQITGK